MIFRLIMQPCTLPTEIRASVFFPRFLLWSHTIYISFFLIPSISSAFLGAVLFLFLETRSFKLKFNYAYLTVQHHFFYLFFFQTSLNPLFSRRICFDYLSIFSIHFGDIESIIRALDEMIKVVDKSDRIQTSGYPNS